jgi:hypothetical protein
MRASIHGRPHIWGGPYLELGMDLLADTGRALSADDDEPRARSM